MKLGILFFTALYSSTAWGLDCEYKRPPFFELVDRADVILFGSVRKVVRESDPRSATIRVKDMIKSGDSLKAKDEIKVSFLKPVRPFFGCGENNGKGLNLEEHGGYLFFLEKRPDGYFSSMDLGTVLDAPAKKSKFDEVIRKYLAGSKKEDLYPLLPEGHRPK